MTLESVYGNETTGELAPSVRSSSAGPVFLSAKEATPQHLPEDLYCAHGDVEYHIPECKRRLFMRKLIRAGDRTISPAAQ